MTVSFLNERGEAKTWKILSFSNPKVFDILKNAKEGQVYDIDTRKNDKDFTEWAGATLVEGTAPAAAGKSAVPYKSTYETPEERAVRQRLIVRQSCLAQAVATLAVGVKVGPTYDEVVALAARYNEWVFEAPDLFETEAPDEQ